jgi:hypothetical protein
MFVCGGLLMRPARSASNAAANTSPRLRALCDSAARRAPLSPTPRRALRAQGNAVDATWGLGSATPAYPDAALELAAARNRAAGPQPPADANNAAAAAAGGGAPGGSGAAACVSGAGGVGDPSAAAAILSLQRRQWWTDARVPPEWRRRAASRPGGEQDFIFSPHARDLALPTGKGGSELARALLMERWLCGEPVVVRGCQVGSLSGRREARAGRPREPGQLPCLPPC